MDVRGLQAGSYNTQINHYAAAPPPLAWPLLVGRAPLRADAFQPRGALVSVSSPVLVGDGGTGKTQLAAALFEQARADGTDLAVWVTASSRTATLTGYADAAGALRLATGDVERAAAAFLTWLANTDRTWIVVLDDVADPADLRGLWPSGPTGRLVLTTRRRDAALRSRGTVIDVDVFTPAESAAYLTAKLDRADPDAAALAADLGHLPLALAQAAALIVDDALTCAEYRALFADRTSRLADLFPNATGDDYDHELAATWSLAADRADALAPAALARPMLLMAATIDPNGTGLLLLDGGHRWQALGRQPPRHVGVAVSDRLLAGRARRLPRGGVLAGAGPGRSDPDSRRRASRHPAHPGQPGLLARARRRPGQGRARGPWRSSPF